MITISSEGFSDNMKKNLDIVRANRPDIQHGRNESSVPLAQESTPDTDIARAITVDDVIGRVHEGLNAMFGRKEA